MNLYLLHLAVHYAMKKYTNNTHVLLEFSAILFLYY
jgi:hypothetical protein